MGSETPWWEIEKAQSLQRRARSQLSGLSASPGDAFLIVTEGVVTEPIYFEFVRRDLQLSAVRIQVMPGKASHPRHVIDTAASQVAEHAMKARKGLLSNTDPKKFDQVWAVIDTDVATREGIWPDLKMQAEKNNVKLAYSSPCFEYWLLLHIDGMTTRGDLIDGNAAKNAVKISLGRDYSTDRKVAQTAIPTFAHKWPQAIIDGERVRSYHVKARTEIPANPSSEVCALMRAMNDSAPKHLRRLVGNELVGSSHC